MQRLDDWPSLLAAAIEAASGRPFCWGAHDGGLDCAHFVSDICRAITGHDPIAPWRHGYSTRIGAALLLAQEGFTDAAEWADHIIGPRERIELAQRGDWVLAPESEDKALGVCLGQRSTFMGEHGLASHLTLDCRACWKIG